MQELIIIPFYQSRIVLYRYDISQLAHLSRHVFVFFESARKTCEEKMLFAHANILLGGMGAISSRELTNQQIDDKNKLVALASCCQSHHKV